MRDRVIASRMGYTAVQVLAAGNTDRIIGFDGKQYVDVDISEALQMKKGLDEDIWAILDALTFGA